MNHQQFEEWLLNDQPLTPDQRRNLHLHTRECTSCAALERANFALRAAPVARPAAGFAGRFQARLARERVVQRRRALIGSLLLGVASLVLFLWLALPYLPFLTSSTPAGLISTLMDSLVAFGAFGRAFSIVAGNVLKVLVQFVPGYVWLLVVLVYGLSSSLWVVSLRKFNLNSQAVA